MKLEKFFRNLNAGRIAHVLEASLHRTLLDFTLGVDIRLAFCELFHDPLKIFVQRLWEVLRCQRMKHRVSFQKARAHVTSPRLLKYPRFVIEADARIGLDRGMSLGSTSNVKLRGASLLARPSRRQC